MRAVTRSVSTLPDESVSTNAKLQTSGSTPAASCRPWSVNVPSQVITSQDPDRSASTKPTWQTTMPLLRYAWGVGDAVPHRVRGDRFATLATTELELPKGRYRIRTISDDGIRVWIGEKKVIDNWTHHAPTEDVAEVDLPAGSHTVRVEHFEIDGVAHLELNLERL